MISLRAGLAAIAIALPAAAYADSDPATVSAPTPFVTLDRVAGDSAIGLEATYPFTKSTDISSGTVLHLDLDAHYVDPSSHFGAYLDVPFNYVSETTTIAGFSNSNSSSSVGGVELGGIYAAPTPVPQLGLIFHAGLVLPTASSDDQIDNTIAQATARPRDIDYAIPGFTLRLGASPVIRSGALFARADLALDVNLSNKAGDTADTVYSIGGGVGVQLATVALAGELVVAHAGTGTNGDSENLSTVAFSAHLTGGSVRPYAALVLPLDQSSENAYHVAISVGVAASLR